MSGFRPSQIFAFGASLQVLVFLAFVALGAFLAVRAWKQAQARRQALAALAAGRGLSYRPERDHAHDEQFAHFEIFRSGKRRVAYNTLAGRVDVRGRSVGLKMGDFSYVTESGTGKDRRTTTHRFSYLICDVPFDRCEDLLIRREGLFDKIAGVFSNKDIDFESAEFSRRFHVASPSRRFAYDVCHPRMMEFLLADDPGCVDIERGQLCLTDSRRVWRPDEFDRRLRWIDGFFGRWPGHLVRELGGAP